MRSILLLAFLMTACAATPDRELASEASSSSVGGNAHPAAYAMDSFVIQKKRPKRPASSDVQFFFKTCEVDSDHGFWSKTSYSCQRP